MDRRRNASILHDPPPTALDRTRIGWLTFAIVVPPLMWTVQFLFLSAFSNYACFPADLAYVPAPNMGWLSPFVYALDAAAIVLAVLSAAISWRYFRIARDNIRTYNDAASLWRLDRLCFMALGGLLSGSGFLAAIVFETIASIMVRSCG